MTGPNVMPRRSGWKLISGHGHPAQLFQLADDPDEQTKPGADLAHTQRAAGMQAEVVKIRDATALQAKVDPSVARRRLIRRGQDQGTLPRLDDVLPLNDARWCRTGMDHSAWSLDVLNTR